MTLRVRTSSVCYRRRGSLHAGGSWGMCLSPNRPRIGTPSRRLLRSAFSPRRPTSGFELAERDECVRRVHSVHRVFLVVRHRLGVSIAAVAELGVEYAVRKKPPIKILFNVFAAVVSLFARVLALPRLGGVSPRLSGVSPHPRWPSSMGAAVVRVLCASTPGGHQRGGAQRPHVTFDRPGSELPVLRCLRCLLFGTRPSAGVPVCALGAPGSPASSAAPVLR